MNEKMLSLEALTERCRRLQAQGQRIVLTNGCFDLLHVGHVRSLRRARALGDALVVALNSDDSVRAFKGPGRPIVPEQRRAEVLAALACVDYVTTFGEPMADRVVAALRPQVYVKGGDYAGCRKAVPEAELVASYGGLIVFLDVEPGASTTDIIDTILRRERDGLLAPAMVEAGVHGQCR